ncbi:MAG: glycosyltransferase [Acidobacteriaceae bacterium]|nr:glycosyltransferase [Acidobacteriaceae bacterium]
MHFGIISPPVPGHIHPFGALGRELIARGHRVTLFHMPDVEQRARREGLEFVSIGASDHPAGTLPGVLSQLTRLNGLAALRFTIDAYRKTTEMFSRDAPQAMRAAGVEFLLVDQTELEGSSIAARLGLRFVTICAAMALDREASIPPPFTDWPYSDTLFARARNRLGYAISDRMLRGIPAVINRFRKQWALRPIASPRETFSALAEISQQPPAFDYPRRELPKPFHYVGPLRRPPLAPIPFPWEKLDGRPLIYASLGTLQNAREATFRSFAEACIGIDAQLVLTHGGGLTDQEAAALPGNPVVVPYAPQLELLERAGLTLTHAGLNTVLDSLSCGVPMVTVPITYEQPAIAGRVAWCGAGRVVPFAKLKADRLRYELGEVLSNPSYRAAAARVRESIQQAGGVRRAADLIESFLP